MRTWNKNDKHTTVIVEVLQYTGMDAGKTIPSYLDTSRTIVISMYANLAYTSTSVDKVAPEVHLPGRIRWVMASGIITHITSIHLPVCP